MVDATAPPADPNEILRSRQFPVLLVLAAFLGVVTSAVSWGFLQLIYQIQQGVYAHLPERLGFSGTPEWWSLPVLAIAGLITALAIVRFPGNGGHVPAKGLSASPTQPIELPGVILAALASIGLGAVVGPEAPLIALGGGLGFLAFRLLRRDGPPQIGVLLATASTFAAISFLFGSPAIAAVLLIEAAGVGGPMLPLVLVPGLTAAGVGSLISIGLGNWTGLGSTHISLGVLPLEPFARPDLADFAWTIPLAAVIAVGTLLIFRIANELVPVARSRPMVVLPVAGLAVAGLAIAFQEAAGKDVSNVLFSGEEALSPLVAHASTWSLSALGLVIAFKGLAYAVSLGSFRGGPVFPALFLGSAAGLMAGQLPGFEVTPAIAVGMGAAVVAVLRLPLSSVILALVLASKAGLATSPLIIVGVVVAYLTAQALSPAALPGSTDEAAPPGSPQPA
jgi:H+/Cl- antiporter ClcA